MGVRKAARKAVQTVQKEAPKAPALSRGQRKRQEKHTRLVERKALTEQLAVKKAELVSIKKHGPGLGQFKSLADVLSRLDDAATETLDARRARELRTLLGRTTLNARDLQQNEQTGIQLLFQRWNSAEVRNNTFEWVVRKLEEEHQQQIAAVSELKSIKGA